MNPKDEARFAEAVAPLTKEDFWKKRVLDAGCGEGKNSFWAVRWGAREVVAFDEDPKKVEAASKLLDQFGNARAGTGSLYATSYSHEFDMALAIDSLSSVENPALAVQNLARAVKPGSLVVVHLPSLERSPWFLKFFHTFNYHPLPVWRKEAVHALFDSADYREAHLFGEGPGWTAVGVVA